MSGTPIHAEGYYRNASLSPSVLTDDGTLYVSGQLPLDDTGAVIGEGDIDRQLDRVWEQIDAIVTAAGGTRADIVRITGWTVDIGCVAAIWAKREEVFRGLTPPASALLIVAGLVRPGALVEIDAVAHLGRETAPVAVNGRNTRR